MSATGLKDGKRKLAAIMFTDIVRYSALSHTNEALALELLEEHRAIARRIFAEFRGKEVKTIGDAFLVTFESALDAVECATHLQIAHRERNRGVASARAMKLRIGIHLGDVVASEGDVYGDGVNIAARLQYLAKPGAICVSGSVFYQIESKVKYPVSQLGTRKLKNISKAIAVYALQIDCEPEPLRSGSFLNPFRLLKRSRIVRWSAAAFVAFVAAGLGWYFVENGGIQSRPDTAIRETLRVAVLPFENISLTHDDEYLSEGMTEELISNLSRLRQLRVLARASVVQYKAASKSADQIGKELKVSALIQGSVRKMGDLLRITVQFVDVASQEARWSREYNGRVDDIFELQSKIADEIVAHFRGRSLASALVEDPARDSFVPDAEAYNEYLKGRYYLNRRTEESLLQGIGELKKSIQREPRFAPAYAALANAAGLQSYYGLVRPREAMKQVSKFSEKSLSMDPQSVDALVSLAEAEAYFHFNAKKAEELFQRAIEMNPMHPIAHSWYAEFLASRGRFPEAITEINQALALDPLSLIIKTAAANVNYFASRLEDCVAHGRTAMEMDPSFMLPYFWLGMARVQTSKFGEGLRLLEKANHLSGETPMMKAALAYGYAKAGKLDEAEKILRELGEMSARRYVSAYHLASVYVALGRKEKAMLFLNKAFEERSSHISLVKVDPSFKELRGDSDFDLFVRKLPF
ncbi:MAG TPA: adenylate/guanylate cyclase domain-containing protein [Bdellovibrionota bacterium]|nr:adenylate/guanylate cyclase domain-containing protein [Bdellovibrionota bacterium]